MSYCKLRFDGQIGNISATLTFPDGTTETEKGLKDEKAVNKWAKGAAQLHKQAQRKEEFTTVTHYVSGDAGFNL